MQRREDVGEPLTPIFLETKLMDARKARDARLEAIERNPAIVANPYDRKRGRVGAAKSYLGVCTRTV